MAIKRERFPVRYPDDGMRILDVIMDKTLNDPAFAAYVRGARMRAVERFIDTDETGCVVREGYLVEVTKDFNQSMANQYIMEDYFEPTAWEPQDEPDDFDSNVDDVDYEEYDGFQEFQKDLISPQRSSKVFPQSCHRAMQADRAVVVGNPDYKDLIPKRATNRQSQCRTVG